MKKNEDVLQKIISRFTTAWQKTAKQAVRDLYKLLDSGKKVDVAVKELARKYPELFMLTGIEDALIEAAAYGYGIVPEILTTAQQAQWQKALNRPWADDNMKLSERLHGASKKMRESIIDTIRTQMKLNASWIKTARELYDGYNSGKAVVRMQELPNYLNVVRRASSDASQLALARKAWRNIDRLGRNGAPNQALKTAYKKLLQAAEAGSAEALEKACYVAMQEKSRYVAERIARTEMARAYADGFLANAEADSDIVAFKWKTGTRHPMFDICDVYAKADMYGLGAGIYPKDKLPPLPAHPHCMCRLVEMYQLDINGKKPKENIKAGVTNYLNKLTDKQRENLLGIQGNKAYNNGESWEHCLRGWQGVGKQESRLRHVQLYKIPELGTDVINDEYHSSKNIIRKFDTRKVRNSRYNMMISEHVKLKPRIFAEVEHQIDQAIKVLRLKSMEAFPKIVIISHQDIVGALGAYIAVSNKLYLSEEIFNTKANIEILKNAKGELSKYKIATIVHELIHWIDAQKYEKKYGKIIDQRSYVLAIRELHKVNVDKLKAKGYNISEISNYANESDILGCYEEVMTEYRSLVYLKKGGNKCITKKPKRKRNYGKK